MGGFLSETILGLTEPFSIKSKYPLTDYQRPDGTWGLRHEIMPHQKRIHDGKAPSGKNAKFICFSSGVGAGKTYCLCVQMLYYLKTYPGIKICVSSAFDYFFVEFLLPTWYQVLDPNDPFILSHNVKDRSYKMTNGSQIRFHAYIDPENIRGWEAHVIWIDEGAQIGHGNNELGYAIWTQFISRLRAKPDDYPHAMYVTQNPSGHNWVWKVFIKPEPGAPQPLGDIGKCTRWGTDPNGNALEYYEWEKEKGGDVFYAITCSSHANKHLAAGYISSMLGAYADQKATRERMVEGKWTPINSLVYEAPLYSTETHCIDYQAFLDFFDYDEIPSWLRVVVGIDCGGQRSPWAIEYYLQTEAREGYPPHWICFDEIYLIGETWNAIADLILAKEKSYGFKNIQYWIDPISSNQRQGPTQITIEEEFRARGITTHMPRGYNTYSGFGRVQSFLERDRSIPCPYKEEDDYYVKEDGELEFTNGHAQVYYLSGVPGKARTVYRDGKDVTVNSEGYACPGNLAEKTVYRFDNSKQREPKAAEEGLTPVQPMKVMARDDHAQTAEYFAFLGIKPLETSEKRGRKYTGRPMDGPKPMYGSGTKHRRL